MGKSVAPGDVVNLKIYNEQGRLILNLDGVLLFVHVPKKSGLSGRGIVESSDWNKQFIAQGHTRASFTAMIRECIARRTTIEPPAGDELDALLASDSLRFMFGDAAIDRLAESALVQANRDEIARVFKHTLARIYQCEPPTNTRLNVLSLIDTQSILNTKHSLAASAPTSSATPTLQMFRRRDEKLEWKALVEKPPGQYDNISQRPRDILAVWFAISNSRVVTDDVLVNHGLLVMLQMFALPTTQLYPLSTRRNTNTLAAMNFDNPGATLKSLAVRPTRTEAPEAIELTFLGQPLTTGVNAVTTIETRVYS